jgi:hypothetical protein
MWSINSEKLAGIQALRFFIKLDRKPASFADVIRGWQQDAAFRSMYNDALAGASFSAFRWETPPVTSATLTQPFEFVLLGSPLLKQRLEPEAFAEHFDKSPEADVVEFPNLSGDAILVVPSPKGESSAYEHLASFVREAPESQRHALWQHVGAAMSRRIGADDVLIRSVFWCV